MYDTILVLLSTYLLITLGADEHDHSFALEVRYVVGFAIFGEVGSKSCEKEFALLFEDDRASAEEDVCLHFVAFFEELDRVLEFEVIIVVIGLRTETDLLHLLLFLVCFRLFLFLFLRIEEFLVVNDAADRRRSRWSDLDEVKILVIRYFHSLLIRVDTLLYIVADQANLSHTSDLVVNTVRIFFDNSTTTWSGRNSSYCFNNL